MKMSRGKFIGSGLLLTAGAVLTDAFLMERFFIETNEFYIGPAKKATKNIKIVQLSDLHLHSINHQLIHLTKKLNKLQPDLIAITGDAIDKTNSIPLLNDFLKLIDRNIQKVAILGNWEYQAKINLDELDKVYTGHNCKLLVNQSTQYSFQNKTVSITGVDDYRRGNPDFAAAIKEYQKSDYHIILTHCPQYSDHISEQIDETAKADFILSGHTHGGQVNFLGYAPFVPEGSGRYIKGWYENVPRMYVSKGVGTGVMPIRFGARAEIAIFNLAT